MRDFGPTLCASVKPPESVFKLLYKAVLISHNLSGAFAKTVTITNEAVGTPPTIANMGAQALCPP